MPEANPKKRGSIAQFVISFRSKPSGKTSGPRAGSIDSSLTDRSVRPVKRNQKNDISVTRQRKSLDANYKVTVAEKIRQDSIRSRHSHDSRRSFPVIDVSQAYERDEQTGEVIDHTDMLHSLVDQDNLDPAAEHAHMLAAQASAQPGELIVSKFSSNLWMRVLDYLSPADAASLAFSCKAFRDLLGLEPWEALNLPDNNHHKINFLAHMDRHLPKHLLCFPCATYHVRTRHGQESLKPTNIANPLFNCPHSSNPEKTVSRTRITHGRALPFTFVQLALRAHQHSPDHGITTDSLSRRYKDRDESTWSHQTRYAIVDGHLLLRVVSTCYATPALPPAGLRHLLYSRNDFVPYFSVCAHWRDGVLMPMTKCALSHIPKPPDGGGVQRVVDEAKYRLHRPHPIISLCSECRPMRRCPECPTEYLIELKMAEDKSDPVNLFKQALVVTRWSDLGDGSSPSSPEWAAINGEGGYDSFGAIGRRAVSGRFEALYNGDLIPGQRMLSMNPENEKLGERGHNWY